MTLEKKIEVIKKAFLVEYGEKHYQVCEGSECICRKILLEFIEKQFRTFATELKAEVLEEVAKAIPKKTDILTDMTAEEEEGWNEAVTEFRRILKTLQTLKPL